MELVDILCLQANIYLVSFNIEITSSLFLSHSRLASILCRTCCVPLNHNNSNHIKLSIFITNTFINYYDEGGSCQVLTIRERRRFKSIPTQLGNYSYHTPILPPSRSHQVTFGTTQVQSRVRLAPHRQRYYQSTRELGTLTYPWTYAIGSLHILTASRVRTLTARVPGLS